MKPLICVMLAGVMLGGATVSVEDAEAGGRKHRKHRVTYEDDRRYRGDDDHHPHRRYISHREVHVIREYYGPRYRHAPRGVRKHYYRRGYLPAGRHRRVEPYPVFVRDVVVLPRGYRRGIIDGHAVIYNSRGMIIDIAVLF
jgi:Ni/Co efflux regulator RcnB